MTRKNILIASVLFATPLQPAYAQAVDTECPEGCYAQVLNYADPDSESQQDTIKGFCRLGLNRIFDVFAADCAESSGSMAIRGEISYSFGAGSLTIIDGNLTTLFTASCSETVLCCTPCGIPGGGE